MNKMLFLLSLATGGIGAVALFAALAFCIACYLDVSLLGLLLSSLFLLLSVLAPNAAGDAHSGV